MGGRWILSNCRTAAEAPFRPASIAEKAFHSSKRSYNGHVLAHAQFTRQQLADVMVDVKRRIHGGFYIVEQDDEKIVLQTTRTAPWVRQKGYEDGVGRRTH